MFKIILPAVSFLIRTTISCEHKGTIQYENYIILAILKIPKINDKCSSPIDDDEITSGSTKTQILLKVTDYHNKKSFLICWTSRIRHHPVVMLRNYVIAPHHRCRKCPTLGATCNWWVHRPD